MTNARHLPPVAALRPARFLRAPLLGLLAAMQIVGCSSSDGPSHDRLPPAVPAGELAGRAIRVYVGKPGNLKRVDFGPARPRRSGPSDTASSPLKPNSLRPQDLVVSSASSLDGLALVWGAAVQCGMGQPEGTYPADVHPSMGAMAPQIPSFSSVYVFDRNPATCDEQVAFSETLLCIADRLEEVASSANAIIWDRLGQTTASLPGVESGPWTIMPQKPEDRFVAREMAIDALTQMVMLDTVVPDQAATAGDNRICAEIYAQAANNAGWAEDKGYVFGAVGTATPEYFEPKRQVSPFSHEIAQSRLAFHGHALRAGARLLKGLITESVSADMAEAERRRARATDTVRGARAAWGFDDGGDGAYNSLLHAVRSVSGRWAVATTLDVPDPLVVERQQLQTLIEPRLVDVAPSTAGQEKAISLVAAAGIVLPQSVIDGEALAFRSVLEERMLKIRAADRGLETYSDEFVEHAVAVSDTVAQIPDADLRFALTRQLAHYAQLTSQPMATAMLSESQYGFTPVPEAQRPGGLDALGGIAIDGGLGICEIGKDIIGLLGGGMASGQIAEEVLGEPGLLHADKRQKWPGQDSFALAQSFLSRLTVLREVSTWTGAMNPGGAADVAGKAVAEIQAWAGPGKVSVLPAGESAPTTMSLYLTGFRTEDLPAGDSLLPQLRLVYGEPWVAECAAGLRKTCPAGFEQDYVVSPTTETALGGPGVNPRRLYGTDGIATKLQFSVDFA